MSVGFPTSRNERVSSFGQGKFNISKLLKLVINFKH